MLSEAAERGISPKDVPFDSRYTARSIINPLSELDWKYVARIKSNRLKAQAAHLHLGLMARCLTQQVALTQGQTVYASKRDLFHQSIPNQLPFSEQFLIAA